LLEPQSKMKISAILFNIKTVMLYTLGFFVGLRVLGLRVVVGLRVLGLRVLGLRVVGKAVELTVFAGDRVGP
jgi:hypothetical protein